MSAESPKKPAMFCPECGKRNAPGAEQCWFCLGPLPAGPEITYLEAHVPEVPPPPRSLAGWTVLAMLIALVAVHVGIGKEAPGLALLLALVVGPALLVTLGASAAGRAQGRPLSPGEATATFVTTAGASAATVLVTLAIIAILPVLTVLALVVAVLVICTGGCGNF